VECVEDPLWLAGFLSLVLQDDSNIAPHISQWQAPEQFCLVITKLSSAFEWGTTLQGGSSRLRFPILLLDFYVDYDPGIDSTSSRIEYREYFLEG